MKVGSRIVLVIALLGALCAAALFLVVPAFDAQQSRYAALIARDAQLQLRAAELYGRVQALVAARHAYLITGRGAEREAFRSAQRQWDLAVADARDFLIDDPVRREQLDDVDALVRGMDRDGGAHELDLAEEHAQGHTVDPAESSRVVAQQAQLVEDIGTRLDQFDRGVGAMQLDHARTAREHGDRAKARILTAGLAVLVAAIFSAAALLMWLRAPIVELTSMAQRIAVGQHQRIGWTRRDELGDLGRAIEAMSEALGARQEELRERSALLSLDASLGAALNQAHDVRAVAEGALGLVARSLDAFAGVLFVTDETGQRFVAEATFGAPRAEVVAKGLVPGEGFLGAVARSGPSFFIRPAPDTAPRLETATADIAAAAYAVYPVRRADDVIAVLELAFARDPDEALIEHLDGLIDQVGIALANALVARDRDALLKRLESQYDELRLREERLRTQSDTLDQQARELARKNGELQTVNQTRSQFIATMSHELRTPLNSILGFTELLLSRSTTLSGEDRRSLGEVQSAGRHLLTLINDILDLARIGAGRLGLRRSALSIAQIAREALEALRPQAEARGLRLEADAVATLTVDADPSRLRQVLLNLAGNAVKFTDTGSVTVRARPVGEMVRVEVIDTGPGISAADTNKLFREFSQLDSSGRRHEGSGLGLAIARELIIAHGGEIGVESEPGTGSTFWFTLPRPAAARAAGAEPASVDDVQTIVAAPAARVAAPIAPSVAPGPTATGPARRVLLVEDHPRNARLIEQMLDAGLYAIEHVSDGLVAVERALADPPALVLLDLELPGIDGFEVARRLRDDVRTARVPIIAVTARAMPSEEARARAIGCDDFVTKPVEIDRLRAAMESALGRTANAVQT